MQDHDSKKREIIKCFHCGNETPMLSVGQYSWGSRDMEFSDFDFLYEYELFACPVCHKVTLRETYSDESMIRYMGGNQLEYSNEQRVLFPLSNIESTAVPQKIKGAYEAALKTKGIDNSICLMGLRRTLELILKDQGATKWGLKNQIEEIAGRGLLPGTLKEASSLAKMLGDTAAHDKELEIDSHDVEAIAEFIGFIIEYLYIVPTQISTYKRTLDAKTPPPKEE